MKQYFTGFFSAVCLTASAFLYIGATDVKENIILRDKNGRSTFINALGMTSYNSDGKVTAFFGTDLENDCGQFKIANSYEEIRLAGYVDSKNNGALGTYCSNNSVGTLLSSRDRGGNITVYSSDPSINNGWRGGLSVSEKGDGLIELWNHKSNINVLIGSLYNKSYKGDGFINLFDRYGDYGWGATGKN